LFSEHASVTPRCLVLSCQKFQNFVDQSLTTVLTSFVGNDVVCLCKLQGERYEKLIIIGTYCNYLVKYVYSCVY